MPQQPRSGTFPGISCAGAPNLCADARISRGKGGREGGREEMRERENTHREGGGGDSDSECACPPARRHFSDLCACAPPPTHPPTLTLAQAGGTCAAGRRIGPISTFHAGSLLCHAGTRRASRGRLSHCCRCRAACFLDSAIFEHVLCSSFPLRILYGIHQRILRWTPVAPFLKTNLLLELCTV